MSEVLLWCLGIITVCLVLIFIIKRSDSKNMVQVIGDDSIGIQCSGTLDVKINSKGGTKSKTIIINGKKHE